MNGLGCATFGPRSSALGRLGVCVVVPVRLESGPKQKGPPRTGAGRAEKEGALDAIC
jgi:hypothetical protein